MITYDDGSFDLDVSDKDLAGAEHVMATQRQLIAAVVRHIRTGKITKAKIAAALGVNKSTVSRMLSGNANLTARSIGELCWAAGVRPSFRIFDMTQQVGNLATGHVDILAPDQVRHFAQLRPDVRAS